MSDYIEHACPRCGSYICRGPDDCRQRDAMEAGVGTPCRKCGHWACVCAERLSDERLAEILDHFGPDPRQVTHWEGCWKSHPTCVTALLLAHIAAQQAEIDRLQGQAAALRDCVADIRTRHDADDKRCARHEQMPDRFEDPSRVRDELNVINAVLNRLEPALADTETVAREHDRRLQLEGARNYEEWAEQARYHNLHPTVEAWRATLEAGQ